MFASEPRAARVSDTRTHRGAPSLASKPRAAWAQEQGGGSAREWESREKSISRVCRPKLVLSPHRLVDVDHEQARLQEQGGVSARRWESCASPSPSSSATALTCTRGATWEQSLVRQIRGSRTHCGGGLTAACASREKETPQRARNEDATLNVLCMSKALSRSRRDRAGTSAGGS